MVALADAVFLVKTESRDVVLVLEAPMFVDPKLIVSFRGQIWL